MGPVLAVSAIVVSDGRLLMVRRDDGPYAGRWTLPGGRVESGELMADAVRREVSEETGLRVRTGEVAGIREVRVDGHHYVIVVHHAVRTGGALEAGDDATEARWVPLDRVRRLRTTPGLVPLLRRAGTL